MIDLPFNSDILAHLQCPFPCTKEWRNVIQKLELFYKDQVARQDLATSDLHQGI